MSTTNPLEERSNQCEEAIVEMAITITGADMGAIQLLDSDSGRLHIVAQSGFEQPFLDFFNQSQPEYEKSFKQTERIVVDDVAKSPIFVGTPASKVLLAAGVRAMQSTPLISRSGQTVGMLSTYNRKSKRPTDQELRILDKLMPLVADLIEKIELGKDLHEQRSWLHTTLSSIGDAVIATDTHGRITFMNPVTESLTGWTGQEAKGKPLEEVFKIINAQTRQPAENPVARVLEEGIVVGLANHTILIARNGTETPIADSAAPINNNGKITGVILVFRDVTSYVQAEGTKAWLTAIIASSEDAIISKTLEGIIVSWNQSAEKIFGYTAKEAIGQHITLIIPKERLNEEDMVLSRLREGKSIEHFETERRTKDGRTINISLSVSPIKNAEGQVIGASKIARDLTKIKDAEKNIRKLLTPLLPVRPGLLILPIIGAMDKQRINQLKEQLLKGIPRYRAKVVVMDVTGLGHIEIEDVKQITSIAESARLMGTQVILTGMSESFSEMLVSSKIKFDTMMSVGDLERGIEEAERMLMPTPRS